jgi:hypothetical protein
MTDVSEVEENNEDIPLEGEFIPADKRLFLFNDLKDLSEYILLTGYIHGELQTGYDRKTNKKVYALQVNNKG